MGTPLGVDYVLVPPLGRQARLVDPHQDGYDEDPQNAAGSSC